MSWDDPEASKKVLAGIEEYAIECAIAKVMGSEALDFVADEGVQIHGGYGFHHDYAVERAYRDSRINRIFEGTNEINRLLTVGMLLKRAAQNRLALMPAVMQLIPQLSTGEIETKPLEGPLGVELEMVERAKEGLVECRARVSALQEDLEQEQEVNMAIADIPCCTDLRRRVRSAAGGEAGQERARASEHDGDGASIPDALTGSATPRRCSARAWTGEAGAVLPRVLRRLTRALPTPSVAARREIAGRLLAAGKYVA
ncbi:MAG: acyl-CoA dehydrogenase family protein [Bryobacterales bacterium]